MSLTNLKLVSNTKTKFEKAQDYLTIPFYKTINAANFSARTQEAKLLVGVTGQGKTYFAATDATPYLFDKHDMVERNRAGLLVVTKFHH